MVVRGRFPGAGVNDYLVSNGSTPMKMERLESSETSTLKAQTQVGYPKDKIRHSTHGEGLKSRDSVF